MNTTYEIVKTVKVDCDPKAAADALSLAMALEKGYASEIVTIMEGGTYDVVADDNRAVRVWR
jgi:hypothetical protein